MRNSFVSTTTENKKSLALITFILLFVVSFSPLIFGNDWCKDHGYLLLLLYSLVGTFSLLAAGTATAFATPNAIVFLYITWSMTIGAWGHAISAVLLERQYQDYLFLQRLDEALCLIMLTISFLVPISLFGQKKMRIWKHEEFFPRRPLYVSVFVLSPFLFVPIDLSMVGGNGTVNNIPRALVLISLILIASNIKYSYRYIYYLLIITANATISSFNKREAIFLIFTIIYIEAMRGKININTSNAIKFIFISFFLIIIILSMSIVRGYGSFGQIDNIFQSFNYVLPYIKSYDFLSSFLNNIEANYFFFHAVNAIEMVLEEPDRISFGSTIFKFLFLPIPRSVFPWKPDSAIGLYTTAYNPDFREIGGSYPINIAAEFVWNFWWFAPLAGFLLALIFSSLQIHMIQKLHQRKGIEMSFFLFIYMNCITLARGSGFDQFILELLLALFFTSLALQFRKLFLRPRI